MQKKKSGLKMVLAAFCLIAVAVAMVSVWYFTAPEPSVGLKYIEVDVVHGDGQRKSFQLKTNEGYLGRALVDNGIVVNNTGEYGLYIQTADGETANSAKQEWWCITKDSAQVDTGADATPIADGEHYELTLMSGLG